MGRMRGCLWLTAGLVVAVLAGVVGFLIINRYNTGTGAAPQAAATQVSVAVAARAVTVGSHLAAEDVEVKQMAVEAAPEGAVPDLAGAVGRVALVDLYPGEVLLAQRLVDPNVTSGDGRTALLISEGQVLMALPADDLMSTVGVLKPGDHVDLLFSLDFPYATYAAVQPEPGEAAPAVAAIEEEDQQVTFSLLQNIVVAAVVRATNAQGAETGAAQALLLTVNPQDALTLKYAVDAGGVLDIVLRARGAEGPFEVEPVDQEYLIDRYEIPGGRR